MCSPLQTEGRPEVPCRPCHTTPQQPGGTPQPGVQHVPRTRAPALTPAEHHNGPVHAPPGVSGFQGFAGHAMHACHTHTNEWPVSVTQDGLFRPPIPVTWQGYRHRARDARSGNRIPRPLPAANDMQHPRTPRNRHEWLHDTFYTDWVRPSACWLTARVPPRHRAGTRDHDSGSWPPRSPVVPAARAAPSVPCP